MALEHRTDVLDLIADLKAGGKPFALATVVRTVAATAVKAGAKAVILPDGTVSEGWIGGGCARAAVLKAAQEAIADGAPRLVSTSRRTSCRSRVCSPATSAPASASPTTCVRVTAPWTSSSSRSCRGRRS